MEDDLNLDDLAKLAAEYAPGDVWLYEGSDIPEWCFNSGGCLIPFVQKDDADKLATLLKALPRLIELARIGQQMPELEEGQELAILNPPQAAEQWLIDVDDI